MTAPVFALGLLRGGGTAPCARERKTDQRERKDRDDDRPDQGQRPSRSAEADQQHRYPAPAPRAEESGEDQQGSSEQKHEPKRKVAAVAVGDVGDPADDSACRICEPQK